jgi:indolepyruvate ferredoxin oxidoreductase
VDTPLGRKRRIDQSACNVDLSCLEGFCPSFVTLDGALPRRPAPAPVDEVLLPEPQRAAQDTPCEILISGIGGSGVITVGAILGMAALMEGRGCTTLDNTGIARKGGGVSTHVRIAAFPEDLFSARIGRRKASLVLACDMVVSSDAQALSHIDPGRTRVIVNGNAVPTLAQRLDPDARMDAERLRSAIKGAAGAEHCEFIDASEIAEILAGDAIYTNMVMTGFAWQKGLVPLTLGSILRAIELNGNDVAPNLRAFALGRQAAHAPGSLDAALGPHRDEGPDEDLDAMVRRHMAFLGEYQDAAYAERYRALVERVRDAEAGIAQDGRLAMQVAQGYFRLLAIKDEYEIGRLYADGVFAGDLRRKFSGEFRIRYHLAPPLLARPDPVSGRIRKRAYGPWMAIAFRALARARVLRGSPLDIFGYTAERRMERRLIAEYEATVQSILEGLRADTLDLAVEIAGLPQKMRGFGHVKLANIDAAKRREAELIARYRAPAVARGHD